LGTQVVWKGHHEGGFFILRGNFDKIDGILERDGENRRANFGREEDSDSFDDIIDLVLTHDVIEFIGVFILEDLLEFRRLDSLNLSDGDVVVVVKEVLEPGAY
jgi:hypothetical protein